MASGLCVIGRVALVLSKSGAFNDTPGAEEAIERRLIADDAHGGASCVSHDTTGKKDDV